MEGYYEFARFYFATIGYWLVLIGYFLPVITCIIQVAEQGTTVFPGSWTLYHMVMSFALWLFCGLIHIIYIVPFISFIDAREQPKCVCNAPEVLDLDPDSDEETKLAWEFATEQYEKVCNIECPPPPKDCPFEQLVEQSESDWRDACATYTA